MLKESSLTHACFLCSGVRRQLTTMKVTIFEPLRARKRTYVTDFLRRRKEKSVKSNNRAVFAAFITVLILEILFLSMIGNAQSIPSRNVLTVDRSSYALEEQTVYSIRGAAPNSVIYWSSWKNGVSTGEVNASYGQITDAFGNWSATAGPWTQPSIGLWKKQATVGGKIYTATFEVQPHSKPGFADKA